MAIHAPSHRLRTHPTPKGGRCRIRIYLPEDGRDAPIVLCSELPNNLGFSITHTAEVIAGEVLSFHHLPKKPIWIEHHPLEARGGDPETFDLVLFSGHEVSEALVAGQWRKEIGVPTAFKRLERQSVEALVGEDV